jgi:hypothetical protein
MRELKERPGPWEKRPDKAAATWKRHQVVHSGPYRENLKKTRGGEYTRGAKYFGIAQPREHDEDGSILRVPKTLILVCLELMVGIPGNGSSPNSNMI